MSKRIERARDIIWRPQPYIGGGFSKEEQVAFDMVLSGFEDVLILCGTLSPELCNGRPGLCDCPEIISGPWGLGISQRRSGRGVYR